MKLFRFSLWLVVALLVLQVVKTLLSRTHYPSASLVQLLMGCSQFFLVLSSVFVLSVAFILKRYVHFRHPFALAMGLFAAIIICLECLSAWCMHHPANIPSGLRPAFAYYYDYYEEDLLQFDPRYAVYNNELFYTLKPDTSFDFRNIEFSTHLHTNRLGLRDEDSSLNAPRVVCIGDSYTMGWGVEQEQSFPARLKALTGSDVLNMGIPSYGTARELINLERIDPSRLQWVILQYCTNDAAENESALQNAYRLPISSHAEYDRLVLAARNSRRYFPGKYFLTIANFYWKELVNRIHPFFNLRWDRTDGLLSQEKQARVFLDLLAHSPIDFKKVRVLVTMMDDKENMRDAFLSTVKRLAAEPPYLQKFGEGLQVLDIAPLLNRNDFFQLDIHFRPSGHEKIARAIQESIRQ